MMIFKQIIKNRRKTFAAYIAFGITITFLEALEIRIFQRVIDMFAAGTLMLSSALLYGAVISTVAVLNYISIIPEVKLDNGVYLDFKLMALKKMSVINYAHYQKIGIGALIQQIENGANAGRYMLLHFYFRFVRELIPTMLLSLIFIAMIDISLIKFILIGYALTLIVTNLVLKKLYKIKSGILVNEEFMNHRLVRGLMELVVFRTNKRYGTEIKIANEAVNEIVAGKIGNITESV